MKKAILILSFLIFSLCLFSQKEEIYFYKNDGIFLSPVEDSSKEIDKILKLLSSKKYKKAKTNLYNLKLNLKSSETFKLLEEFILFLEKPEKDGSDLLGLLKMDIPSHQQIRAEIFWLSGKKYESFAIYDTIYEYVSTKPKLLKSLQGRVKDFTNFLKEDIREVLEKGNFEDFCLGILRFPEKLFKGETYYKAKTLCALIEGKTEEAERYIQSMEQGERGNLGYFVEILKLENTQKLEELKAGNFDRDYQKFAKYLYIKFEDLWLLENMPPFYMEAYNSKNLKLREMAILFCLYFPQIRGQVGKGIKEEYKDLDPMETGCLYPLILGKIIEKERLEEKLDGEKFIFYLSKFLEFLNLLNPCGKDWDGFVKCGFIPVEKDREKIEGQFLALIIRKIKGDL
ncbi:MAG: hypothetical protein WHV67_06060 [Thermoanaerobaculia bacterium]